MPKEFVIPAIFTAVNKFTGPLQAMERGLAGFQNRLNKVRDTAIKIGATAAIAGAGILAPLTIATTSAVKFEDKMADVAKTTGLSGKALDAYADTILSTSKTTRTSIDDLTLIGVMGGQLGVAKDELSAFTIEANKFNVALGSDFSGGVEEAIGQIGKLKNLFKETRQLAIADVIKKSGSAINELSSVGAGTSANITDFTLRIGALPDAIKPSVTATAALGTLFEEVGLDAQISAGGLSNLWLVAGRNIGGFAKQMRLTEAAAKKLLATDPSAFASRFAASFDGMAPDKLAKKLNDLKIGTQETIKVVGALGSGQQRLTELQKISNDAFDQAISLQNEYEKKNNTTAAKLAIAKNNLEAFAITIGTQLLPVLGDLVKMVAPILTSISEWVKNNPTLTKTLLVVAGALGGFLTVVSVVSGIVAAFASPIGLIVFLLGGLIVGIVMIVKHWDTWGKKVLWFLGPIGWLIRLVVEIIQHWKTWGKYVRLLFGPMGFLIDLIVSFKDNWGMVKKAFSDGGLLSGILAIGKVIVGALLTPLQTILEIAAHLPGFMGRWAQAGVDAIERMKDSMGLYTSTFEERMPANWGGYDKTPSPLRTYPALNPKTEQNDALVQQMLSVTQKGSIDLNVKVDGPGKAEVTKTTPNLKPKVTSTLGQTAQY